MATTSRRLALDGRPSIPAAMDLPSTRAAIDQIRTRLEKLDAAVNRSFTTLDASSPQKALESLQTQIAVLSKELDNLTAQVEAAIGERQPAYFAMQMGDDAEDGLIGPPGPAGPQGERGHTLLLDQDDHDAQFVIGPPGERGPAGVPGAMVFLDAESCCSDMPLGFSAPPLPIGANPTASVGLTAVNGSATTFMRSDAAPALGVGISPTWSGTHTFNNPVTGASFAPTSATVPANGLFLPTTDTVGIATASVERLRVNQVGNITVGGTAVAELNALRRSITLTSPDVSGSGFGVLTFISPIAHQSNNGYIGWFDSGNTTSTSLRNAYILSGSTGATATNYGSFMSFATKADGVAGTGTVRVRIESTGFVWLVADNQELQIGAGTDLRLYHNGTDSYIENDTGNLVLKVGGDLGLEEVTVGTTAPAAGAAGALPATPAGYVTLVINGTTRQIPYY